MKSVNWLCDKIVRVGEKDEQGDLRADTLYRWFYPTDRYIVDFADAFFSEGWQQYDTDQDANYFGVWVNPRDLKVLTYAEGDWTLLICHEKDHYNRQIHNMNACYDEGFELLAIDTETGHVTEYRQDREKFLVD